jgi:ATP phosphoribosyltransferase
VRLALACEGATLPADLLELLTAAGLPTAPLRTAACPALVVADDVEWLLAPGADVLAVCLCGAADAGIVGKDLLLEHEPDICELLDLGVVRQRLVYATPASAPRAARQRSRVATRYPRVTRRYFAASGRQVETLTLSAPGLMVALGYADGLVELEHLLQGGEDELVVREEVAACSARLVAGRQARALHGASLATLIDRLREGGGDA